MLNTDEDALVCDLAETYGIYDYRQLPIYKVAVFSCGLRENARIKMALIGEKYPIETLLQALTVDTLNLLFWAKTTDGAKNRNKPQSIYEKLTQKAENDEVMIFTSAEAFEAVKKQILGVTNA